MERDRADLIHFVDAVQNRVMLPLVTDRKALIPDDLREHAAKAWDEVKHTFEAVRAWLHPSTAQGVDLVDDALASVGLTGAQLAAKLAGFYGALERSMGRVHNSIVKWYKGVLEWANLLLGSLSRAFPPAEIIKEYKEFLELSIDYSGAAAQRA